MKYTIHQAKTNLSRLLEEACSGKEGVIARGRQPVAKLVALGSASKNRVPGRLKELISYSADAFDPLTDQEFADLGFE